MILTGKAVEFANELESEIIKYKIEKRELSEEDQMNLLSLITLYETDNAFSTFIDFIIHLYSSCALKGHAKQIELGIEMNNVLVKLFGKEG